jgi:hypothetical protein
VPKISIKARGISEALKSATEIPKDLLAALDDETERAALRVVNDAREGAPYETGALANSIKIYEKRKLARVVGSDRPYAQRQEYEHKTKRGYFRKALFSERTRYREAIEKVLKRAGGGI